VAFQKLARVEQVPPGRTKCLSVGARPVLLANCGGQIHALDGICPHQQKPLEDAVLWECLVDCPWHHFLFDVRTGRNHFPGNVYPRDMGVLTCQVMPLKTYPVEVRGGEIWVELG
jgi:nitrite reductase/ring-hydroxylating ferredoxin subunit